jgi:hypothetical protein
MLLGLAHPYQLLQHDYSDLKRFVIILFNLEQTPNTKSQEVHNAKRILLLELKTFF